MGQAVEDMLDGICCQVCGVYLDDFLNDKKPNGFGYPKSCQSCE